MKDKLIQISDCLWELPISYKQDMKVPVRIIASEQLISTMEEIVFEQAANVASLPGLVDYVVVLPDAHSGYGAPIGTVFATNTEDGGVISPGAVGYDINCGMRLITTNLTISEVKPKIAELINLLFNQIPPGVGREGFLQVTYHDLDKIMIEGAKWMVGQGIGWQDDLDHIEEKGRIDGADPEKVSQNAKERGKHQLSTLGSGNHYLEIQKVAEIFDATVAQKWGITAIDQIMIMLHSGSRGLGHQVATDYIRSFGKKLDKYGIRLADAQLSCAPFTSSDGQNYYQAMAAAANFAFANRQAMTAKVRQVFEKVFAKKAADLGMKLVYDVAHNIAKLESGIRNKELSNKKLLIHRKGATRSFPGQPVIIGGSMETGSYLLLGTEKARELTFGSTAHGSGRTMSRHQAKKAVSGRQLEKKLESEGITVKSASYSGLAEEAGFAYKNIADVVKSVHQAGISTPVASFKPMGNIKG
jgi:tRNA-splicing ligase RtcB